MNLVKFQDTKSTYKSSHISIHSEVYKIEIKETEIVPFTIETKQINNLGIMWAKKVRELHTDNYNTDGGNWRRHR